MLKANNNKLWKDCIKCFKSYPISDRTKVEEWFSDNHNHDLVTNQYDFPLFIGEILP